MDKPKIIEEINTIIEILKCSNNQVCINKLERIKSYLLKEWNESDLYLEIISNTRSYLLLDEN